jgi:hypothetical protein
LLGRDSCPCKAQLSLTAVTPSETATLEGVSLDSLSPLLTRGEVLKFDQTKWLRSMDQATISILKTVYTLRVTENKRELVYDLDGLLVGSKSFIL